MFVHRINTYRYIHTTFKTTCPPVNPLKIPVEDAVHAGQSKKKKKSHAYPTLRCTWDVRNKSVDHFPSTTVAARHVSIPWIPIYATSSRRMKRNDMVETQANDIRHQVITRATFFLSFAVQEQHHTYTHTVSSVRTSNRVWNCSHNRRMFDPIRFQMAGLWEHLRSQMFPGRRSQQKCSCLQ